MLVICFACVAHIDKSTNNACLYTMFFWLYVESESNSFRFTCDTLSFDVSNVWRGAYLAQNN